jgi:hypothetical protein
VDTSETLASAWDCLQASCFINFKTTRKIRAVAEEIVMSDHYYGINHGGWGCLWYKGEFAEMVERPLTSKFYYMDNYNKSFEKEE